MAKVLKISLLHYGAYGFSVLAEYLVSAKAESVVQWLWGTG